jgi:hypothetical protein
VSLDRPKSRLLWLRGRDVQVLLRDLATGRTALSHDGMQQHPAWRTVLGDRDMLTASGVLPLADKRLLLYQRWLAGHLEAVRDPEQALLRRFVSWYQMRRLQEQAVDGPLQPVFRVQ